MDEPSLLRAILDQPDDDIRRLGSADRLAKNGQEGRAVFIRRQIENARRDDRRTFARSRQPDSSASRPGRTTPA